MTTSAPAHGLAVSSGPHNRICAGCGVIAPLQRSSCVVCGAAFPTPPLLAPAGVGDTRWVCVLKCQGVCPTCGGRGAVDGLANGFTCPLCARFAVIPPPCWELLARTAPYMLEEWERARNAPLGADDFAGGMTLGVGSTTAEAAGSSPMAGAANLDTTISFGHPLCLACKAPLDVAFDAAGRLVSTCPRCATSAAYAIEPALAHVFGFVRAALADEQRVDRPFVRITPSADGAQAVKCPGCGAAVVLDGAPTHTCAYCRAVSLVPRRLVKGAPPQPWWVLLPAPPGSNAMAPAGGARTARSGLPQGALIAMIVFGVVAVLTVVVVVVVVSASSSRPTTHLRRH